MGHVLRPVPRDLWCCNSLSPGQVELEGLTGHIEFNSKGQRSNYALKILQFTRNGFRQVRLALMPPRLMPSLFLSLSPIRFSLAIRVASCSLLSTRTKGALQARLLAALLPAPCPQIQPVWVLGWQPSEIPRRRLHALFQVREGKGV